MNTEIATSIRGFVRQRLDEYGETADFTDDDSLIHSGLLDSLGIVYLIMFLEQEFGVDFADFEFEPDEFDTVNDIYHAVCNLLSTS